MDTYTHTTWRVRPGHEDEFVQRWREWIEWSHLQGLGPSARLLRDAESPSTFISFGPWLSRDAGGAEPAEALERLTVRSRTYIGAMARALGAEQS